MKIRQILLVALLLIAALADAQSESAEQEMTLNSTQDISFRYVNKVCDKASELDKKLDRRSDKILTVLQKQERKMQRKLARLDSMKAKHIFGNLQETYAKAKHRMTQPGKLQQYIPSLDSMGTSLKFLQQNAALLSNVKHGEEKLKQVMSKVTRLEDQFQKAEEIKTFLKERKQFLRQQLQQLGFAKQFKKLNKKIYYYNQQVTEYKELLKDRKRVERKALEFLAGTKQFREFMQKNSMLARLLPVQTGGAGNSAAQTGFSSLQTRAQLTTFMQQTVLRTPNGSIPGVQQNIQNAQTQLTDLRNALAKAGAGGGDDLEMPDFKPNSQKTRSFLKRIEYGFNVQSKKSTQFFPVTSDIGLTAGYKLNDRSVIGVGASYKIGLGNGWKNIRITNQGIGLRSYVEWKIKNNFWLAGGYEQNYLTAFDRVDQLKDLSAWQQSGLIGLSKKIMLKTKFVKNAKFQLLWDFLSYQQVPRTQQFVFRIGYGF